MCIKILYQLTCSLILAFSAKFLSTDNFKSHNSGITSGVLVNKLIRPFKLRDAGEMQ